MLYLISGPSRRVHRYLELCRCPWFQPVRTDQPRGTPSGRLYPPYLQDLIADVHDLEDMLRLRTRAYRPEVEL